MKKIFPILFVCFLLVGCSQKPSDVMPDNTKGVLLSVENVSKIGLTYCITNDTQDICTYGQAYSLERKTRDNWYSIDSGKTVYSEAILYTLEPNDKREHAVSWESRYGSLKTGIYRLLITANDSLVISAEFSVK